MQDQLGPQERPAHRLLVTMVATAQRVTVVTKAETVSPAPMHKAETAAQAVRVVQALRHPE